MPPLKKSTAKKTEVKMQLFKQETPPNDDEDGFQIEHDDPNMETFKVMNPDGTPIEGEEEKENS